MEITVEAVRRRSQLDRESVFRLDGLLDVKKCEWECAKAWDDRPFSLLIGMGSDGHRELSIC